MARKYSRTKKPPASAYKSHDIKRAPVVHACRVCGVDTYHAETSRTVEIGAYGNELTTVIVRRFDAEKVDGAGWTLKYNVDRDTVGCIQDGGPYRRHNCRGR